MDKQNNPVCKILEVIWTRNSNTQELKLLPEMKEINIDDTVVKTKKSSKINANNSKCANRYVKRSLFQEKKKEKKYNFWNTNKLNKINCEHNNGIISLRKTSDNLTGSCRITRASSPQIVSNREKLERNQNTLFYNLEQHLFPTKSSKPAELFTSHKNSTHNSYVNSPREKCNSLSEISQISFSKSPQILSNQEKLEINQNTSLQNSEHCLFLTKSEKTVELSTLHRNNELKLLPEINEVKKIFNGLSKTSKMSRPRSPQIISNREKLERNQNTSCHNLEQRLFPTKSSKPAELFTSHKNSTHNSYVTSPGEKCNSLSEVSQISFPKSPQILSNREILERNKNILFHNSEHCLFSTENLKAVELSTLHINNSTGELQLLPEMKKMDKDDGTVKVKKSSKPDNSLRDIKVIENNIECSKKRVKRSLFQVNKNNSTTNKSKKRQREPYSYVINVRKRSHGLSEASNISYLKSPKVISNRKILKMKQDISLYNSEKHLFPTEREKIVDLSMSCSDQINTLYTRDFRSSKSPEIMSNRKRTIEHKNLNKIDVFNYNKINANDKYKTQASNKLNEKSGNVNSFGKVQLKTNAMDSEDIIESSEIIIPPKKHKSKKNKVRHSKKTKSKIIQDELKKSSGIVKTNENVLYDEINYDSLDIINTENILKSPVIELKIKNIRVKPKLELLENQNRQELFKIDDDIQKHRIDTMSPSSSKFKEVVEKTTTGDLKMFKRHRVENTQNTDKNISFTNSKVSVVLATPEHNMEIADKPTIEKSTETILQKHSYIPLIEVDQSPKTQHIKHVLIQSVQSPSNATILPTLFESLPSPTPSINDNFELSFKIDSIESPSTVYENENLITPEVRRKKSEKNPSPNNFDSAKKRKKVCKDGLRGKFRDLINRKKSEARIREYEKDLSKNCQPEQCESALLNIVEAWKEFQTFVLLCYHMKSSKDNMEVQKVLVFLDSCPKNATKNSIIRIYSPWLTIESKTTEILLYVGVIHAEVIEFSGSTRPLGPIGLPTNLNGLLTTVFQSEVLWKCSCPEDAACQCLGELSVYTYLQYMISH